MAPTDDAFSAYLTKHNYGSVEDISQTELDKLIGYHLIYYSYTKQNFMFYNPNGIDAELENPGTYFKFRTKSRDAISTVKDYANGGVIRRLCIRIALFLSFQIIHCPVGVARLKMSMRKCSRDRLMAVERIILIFLMPALSVMK